MVRLAEWVDFGPALAISRGMSRFCWRRFRRVMSGNVVLLFIALFVYMAAASEAHAAQMRQVSRGIMVDDAMVTRFETLGPESRVDDAVDLLLRTTQHEFPVVDGAGRLRRIDHELPRRRFALVHHKERFRTKAALAFDALLREEAEEMVKRQSLPDYAI